SMACGTSVIAANARALPETVKNGRNGFLFRAGNARDLARVARDFMPSRHLSEGALKTARQNSRENAVKRLEKVYEKVLSSTANAKSPQLSGLGAC
ncbi:glycosyltransferase, partial [archaeon]|nr:glycosyltransferase [archaeon]